MTVLGEPKLGGVNGDELLVFQQKRENDTTEREENDDDALSVSSSSLSSTNHSSSCSKSNSSAESTTLSLSFEATSKTTSTHHGLVCQQHKALSPSRYLKTSAGSHPQQPARYTTAARRKQHCKHQNNHNGSSNNRLSTQRLRSRQGRLSDTGILGHLDRLSINESTATDSSEINATTLLQDSLDASISNEESSIIKQQTPQVEEEEDTNEEDFDYDLKIVLTRNTVSDDDEDDEYIPPPDEDDTTVTLEDDDDENYYSTDDDDDDDDDDTITEVESRNQSIDDSLSTETDEESRNNNVSISNTNDRKGSHSASTTQAKEEGRASATKDQSSHCINLVQEMEQVAGNDNEERVGPPTTSSSSSSSQQSSSYNFLFTNHSDLTLPDLSHNYSNTTLLGKLSCSEDEHEKKEQGADELNWFNNNTFDGYSSNSNDENNDILFDDLFPNQQQQEEIIAVGTAEDNISFATDKESGVKSLKNSVENGSYKSKKSNENYEKKKGNKSKMHREHKHPTSVSVTSKGQESEPSNFSSSTEDSINSLIPGNSTQQPPPTSFSSSSMDESKGIINLASTSTQTSPFHSLTHPQGTNDCSLSSPPTSNLSESEKNITKATTTPYYNVEPTFKWKINGSPIGRGSFGTVHLGIDYTTGTLMAVKSIELPSDVYYSDRNNKGEPSLLLDFQREINVLRSLNHENIVRYLGSEVSPNGEGDTVMLYIFQEWVPGGSLAGLLNKFGPLSTPIIQRYLMQILHGLAYLHEHHIIHRDIKGGNILVDDRGVVKLADFGAAKQGISSTSSSKGIITTSSQNKALNSPSACNNIASPGSAYSYETEDSQDMEQTLRGTPYFMAPEVYAEKYGRKCDIWSVGCTVYQMLTANAPWKSLGHKNPIALLLHLKSTVGCPPPFDKDIGSDRSRHKLCHTEIQQIMELCFQRNPRDRPSARRLLRRSFFTKSGIEDDVTDARSDVALVEKKASDQSPAESYTAIPAEPSIEQHSKLLSREEERAYAALSPQIFTDQASHGTKNKSEQNSSQISRGIERTVYGDTTSSLKESRVPVFPSNVGNTGRRLPPVIVPPNTVSKPSVNKLGSRPSEARHIPPLSNSSRRSTAKTVVQLDSSTIGSTISPNPDEPIIYFDLTYSNSNESEDLPVSINPLGAEVTSPLSNCSSSGDNSIGQSISSQPLLSDNWPKWAKERAVQLELNRSSSLAVKEKQHKDVGSQQSSKKTDRTRIKERVFGLEYGSQTSKHGGRSTGGALPPSLAPNSSTDTNLHDKKGLSKQKKEKKTNPFARRKSGIEKVL